MAQTLTPLATFLDRGEGVADLSGALVAASDTELQFLNTNDLILFIENADAAAKTATLNGQPDPFGRSSDVVLNIAAGDTAFFSFQNREMFNLGGTVTVTLDATTSVSVGLYRLTKS